jgi:hypothetical protein
MTVEPVEREPMYQGQSEQAAAVAVHTVVVAVAAAPAPAATLLSEQRVEAAAIAV